MSMCCRALVGPAERPVHEVLGKAGRVRPRCNPKYANAREYVVVPGPVTCTECRGSR